MVAGFASTRHQCCLFFCLDYDANIATPNKGTTEMRDTALPLTKARKGIALRWATVGQSEMHRPASTVT